MLSKERASTKYFSHSVVFVPSVKISWHYTQKAISLHSEWWENSSYENNCIHFLLPYFGFFSRSFSEKSETNVVHKLNATTLSLQYIVTQKFYVFLWILLIKSVLLRHKCYAAPYLNAHLDLSATGFTLTKFSPCRVFSKSFWVRFYACDSWIRALSASCNILLKVNHYIVWRHLRKKTPLPIHSPEYFKF